MIEPMSSDAEHEAAAFHTTRWSQVAAAGETSERAREALAELCQAYWYPLYAFARRLGVPAADAPDVVQGFFARLIETRDLASVTRERGRFRSFLRVALRNHVANVRDGERSARRGGGRVRLAVDLSDAERRFAGEPAGDGDPERAFDQAWARAVLAEALAELEADCRARGRGAVFDALKEHVVAGADPEPLARSAERLGIEVGAARVAAHRLRARFRAALEAVIARTVREPADVPVEIEELFRAFGPP